MPDMMLHYMLSPETLKKKQTEKGDIPPHITVQTDTYVDDTNTTTIDDQYQWLDKDDQRINK